MLTTARRWKWRNHLCFDRLIRVAQADLAGAVIAGLHDVVIALLMPALTALGRHRATRFQPCLYMTNVGISFLRLRLRRRLRQGIISAVQTPALGGHGIAPAVVGAGFTSRLVFFHNRLQIRKIFPHPAIVEAVLASEGHASLV